MRIQRLVLTLALLFAGLSSFAVPAKGAVRAGEAHCVVELNGRNGPKPPRCFAIFSDAVHFGTGGRVRLDRNVRPQDLTDQLLDRYAVVTPAEVPLPCEVPCDGGAARTLIGIDYENQDTGRAGGRSLSWSVGNAFGCSGNRRYANAYMPFANGIDWNDRVSSATGLGDCDVFLHYEHPDWQGTVRACTCQRMGTMNDRTSSLRWRDF